MITVKIQGFEYSIASKIQECDIHKLVKCQSDRDELAAISNIERSVIANLDMQIFSHLLEFLSEDSDYVSRSVKCADVSVESYENLERAKIAIQDEPKLYKQIFKVSQIYHPDRKKSTSIFETGINLINQIGLFLNEYSEMYQDGPDAQEVAAGVENLNKLGAWGTAFALAGKDLTKIDQITAMPAVVVYNALLFNHRESKYMEALHKLKYPS